MGNNTGRSKDSILNEKVVVSKSHFEYLHVIGRGGFGKVWKVSSNKFEHEYALKIMSKGKIIDKRSEKSIRYEKQLLSQINHPFIVNMNFAFQDKEKLYLVMDLLTGGDLRFHIARYRKFSEQQTKFFLACLILGLEYLHSNSIIHRDIKPENLVLDERGYLRITDFGIARAQQKDNFSETSGTPGYMAPEVMCAQNHTCAVDYFALGVLAFECMFGYRPYKGRSRTDIKEEILAKQVYIRRHDIPEGWSVEAADFINRLVQRRPQDRLGFKGIQELKEHPWFRYFPWKNLYEKKINPPFVPKAGDNFDFKHCNAPEYIGNLTSEKYEKYLEDEYYQEVFEDFYYYYNEEDPTDISNSKVNKFLNPHLNMQSISINSENQLHHPNNVITDFISSNSIQRKKDISYSASSRTSSENYTITSNTSTNSNSNNSTNSLNL